MLRLPVVLSHKRSGYWSSKATAANTYNSLHQIDPHKANDNEMNDVSPLRPKVLNLTHGLDTGLFPHGYLAWW